MRDSIRCSGAKLRAGAVWAVLILGVATMLSTSPPEWQLRAEESLSVESEGLGDDVAIRVRVEIPPTLSVTLESESSMFFELTITTDRPATDVLVVVERGGGDGGTSEEARFTDEIDDATYAQLGFTIMHGDACPDDAACVDELIVLLTAADAMAIRYDILAEASMDGGGDAAPPGEITLTLEELDVVP